MPPAERPALLRQFSVKHRLGALTVLCLLAVAVCASVGLWAAHRLTALSEQVFVAKDVVADILPPPLYLIELRLVCSQLVEGSLAPAEAARQVARLADDYDSRIRHWTAHPPYGLERALMGAQHSAGQQVVAAARALVQRAQTEPPAALRDDLARLHALYQQHRAGVDQTVTAGTRFAEASSADFAAIVVTSKRVLWAGLAGSAAALLLGLWLVVRSITQPLDAATRSIRLIADGDLSVPVAVAGRDELATLAAALRQMRDNLHAVVSGVRGNAETVASASLEIAHGNNDLSRRTETQASALQQIAATMDELSATVRHTADNARQGSTLAGEASSVAGEGGQAVRRFVQTMRGIDDSSRQIAAIIGTIDGIAFQTNILALNAAVEAARAGEQGRGFAVVAAEVRSLAQRSAEAAREIRALIATSTERVAQGSALVDQAGRTMEAVVAAIQRVNQIAGEISHATTEQSEGVGQIGLAVNAMDQTTQENSALVEQTAAATESLGRQSQQLLASVAVFKLDGPGAALAA